MDQTTRGSTTLHPALLIAAISVTLLSLTGIAALAGWLPGQSAASPDRQATLSAPAATANEAADQPTARGKPEAAAGPSRPAASRDAPARETRSAARCDNCGVIDEIRQVTRQGQGTGLGAVAGGVVGGALGNTIGKGDGRALATIAGAVGGGLIGNQIEKNQRQTVAYRVTVRFPDGRTQVIERRELPPWRVGDPVRLENGTITPR